MRLWQPRASMLAVTLSFALLGSAAPWASAKLPPSSAITYQGMLKVADVPYTGYADLRFYLYDAPSNGVLVAGPIDVLERPVTDGVFTAGVDFGPEAFSGQERWLEIAVRTPSGSGGSYTTLEQRQRVTPAPCALVALGAITPFVFAGTGNVGIGTNDPIGRLHVRTGASGTSATPGSTLVVESNASQYISMLTHDSGESGLIFANTSGGSTAGGIAYNPVSVPFGMVFRTGGGVTRMTITNNGNVGIGTETTGGFKLAVNGTAANSSGSWSVFSDARLKTNIRTLAPGSLERVLALRGRTFEYTAEAMENNLAREGVHTGFIAQEVDEVFPDWVEENADGYLYITERGTTALMVEALRELRAEKDEQIAEQAARIDALEKRADELEKKNKDMEKRLAAMEKAIEQLSRQP